ncbi:DUF2752 domain-containing protein [Streptomyces alkaliphilus]|uniref:DUF2752 domain-containing protein n=1 Tax=Streptomyces alkaliphilus TaxID=1472722 RepID=UPI002B1F7C59|nr:DUF2752 domain-containing protein [Streptomyces alkaliphilus]
MTESREGGSDAPARLDAPGCAPPTAEPAPGPVRRRSRASRRLRHPVLPPLATLGTGLLGAAYLYRTDPHVGGQWLPRCPFHWLTGLYCPACGGTRMAYDLMHGDLPAAFADNAVLLVLGVPAAAWWGGRWLYEGARGRRYRPRLEGIGTAVVLTIAVLWAVLRNLAGWAPG